MPPVEEAFEQAITRFHRDLETLPSHDYGLRLQDQKETVMRRLTELVRHFRERGTRWTSQIPLIVETPLLVDSKLPD